MEGYSNSVTGRLEAAAELDGKLYAVDSAWYSVLLSSCDGYTRFVRRY